MIGLTLENGLRLLNKREYKTLHSGAIDLIHGNVNDPIPYFLLGMIAAEHANTAKALELFEKSAALDPNNILYQAHRAKALSTLRRQNAAKTAADTARALDINDAFIADTLGVVYSRCGYHEKAIPLFEKAVELDPKNANYHYNLGASAQFVGDFEKAKTAYGNALVLDPDFIAPDLR